MNRVPIKVGSYYPSTVGIQDFKKLSNCDSETVLEVLEAIKNDSMGLLPSGFCGGRTKKDEKLFVLYRY